jgi:hypothetical protein
LVHAVVPFRPTYPCLDRVPPKTGMSISDLFFSDATLAKSSTPSFKI